MSSPAIVDRDVIKVLERAGKMIFVLCTPWKSWKVSGSWIAEASSLLDAGNITATDDVGREILSYVPLPFVADFLSSTGQDLVSYPEPRQLYLY